MNKAKPYKEARADVHRILRGKTIVGHSLRHDFAVLDIRQEDTVPLPGEEAKTLVVPKEKIRDLGRYRYYQDEHGKAMGLKRLAEKFLSKQI